MAKKINFDFFKKLPAREKKITISTMFTLVRIALAPIIVLLMMYGYWGAAFICFVAAALSDMLDGIIARLRNEQTVLGACLDPIADKMLVLSVFFTLAFVHTPLFSLPSWFVFLVLCKETLLVVGSMLFYIFCGYIYINPTRLGKLTTLVQISFIMWLFACYFFQWMPVKTYYVMLGVLLTMIFATLIQYASIGWQLIKTMTCKG
jgi:cardiolipin synthase